MDRWNSHLQKWEEQARQRGMDVDLPYWGQSEILARLSQEEHRGRYYFWFNRELFSREWFSQKLEIAIANAGKRYMPALSVDLPVSQSFRGLGRTPEFFDEFDRMRGEIRRRLNSVIYPSLETVYPTEVGHLRSSINGLIAKLAGIDRADPGPLPLDDLSEMVRTSSGRVDDLVFKIRDAPRVDLQESDRDKLPAHRSSDTDSYYLYQLKNALAELDGLTRGSDSTLANTPAALLVGDAG
jgi:hypothetical protein